VLGRLPRESHEASGESPEVTQSPDALWLLFFDGEAHWIENPQDWKIPIV
jgi:hypothetical protein